MKKFLFYIAGSVTTMSTQRGTWKMKKLSLLIFAMALLSTATGCAWKHIPAAPDYSYVKTIPYTVGIALSDNGDGTRLYVPKVVDSLKAMNVFKNIIFPYRHGDAVDAVLYMSIGAKGSEKVGRDFASGFFTLGLAGSENIFVYRTIALLKTPEGLAIASYNILTTTQFTFGQLADRSEVAAEANNVSCKKIAIELAIRLNNNIDRIKTSIQNDLLTH